VGEDRTLHSVLLTYASDYFLVDMAVRAHPLRMVGGAPNSWTLDHSLYLHRPVRFDRWHRYTQDLVALVGSRGLVMGAIHDAGGSLVATTMQQVLVPLSDGESVGSTDARPVA
jgi:acyl-CoA thioesterase-2